MGSVDLVRKVDSFRALGFVAHLRAGAWRVTEVQAPETGLRSGDAILLVAGADAGRGSDIRQRLLSSDTTALTVMRGNELAVVPYHRPPLQVDLLYLVLAGAGILYLIIGLYALLHGRRSPAGVFFLWSLASAAVYLCTRVAGTPLDGLGKASYVLEELGRLLLPPLTLHLFLLFPVPVLRRRLRRLVPFLYVPAAALATLQADLVFNRGRWFFGGLRRDSLRAFDRLEVALLAAFSLAALAALAVQLARRHGWEQKRQLQWVVLGIAAGYLPFILLYGVPWALHLALPSWTVAAAAAPLALVPLTFAWALLRFRLWDMEIILRGAVSYTATLLLGVLSFSLLHLAISRGLSEDRALARSALSFVSGLAIAAVLVPAERRVRAGIERLQHRGTFAQRQALRELGRELLEERDLPRLCERLQERLAEGLGLQHVALYLADGELLRLAGQTAPREDDDADDLHAAPPPYDVPIAEVAEAWTAAVSRLSSAGLPGVSPQGLERLYEAGFRYAFPLLSRRRPVALLLTAGRLDGEPLNSEELDLLRVVLDQTALALENARLLEELRHRLAEVTRLKQETESILESSPAGIVVLDGSDRVISANGAFARLAGVSRERLVGRALRETLPVEPLPGPEEPLREVSYCEPDGRERHLQLSLAACGRAADDLRVLVVHDVSDRVAMENALKEKDRMAALGMLAAGVAHEVNTPITGISSYAQMLLAETSVDDPRYELLRKVEKQTFRAANIVNDLLEFARDRKQEHRTLPLAGVMRDALESLDDRLRQTPVELLWQPPSNGPTVRGGDQELQQVFVNLIGNALDAMGERGGRLELSVGTEGDRAVACVADNGPGIPRAEQERIFRPFYSTKLASGGTGLGLSISYQIVRRHGGDLRVESEPGHGSRFVVELPLLDGDATGGLW
ncbi:MAG TPA: ATP-binding protein [Thermoanaerobaculia bacterium]|nr:ATP-binding protein [Thermoanaerobaculia bacterium]